MKISNSKKQLAEIISENGGWREGALWAAQDGIGNDGLYNVAAYGSRPVYDKRMSWHKPSNYSAYHEDWFGVSSPVKNWSQTILSREEYFHLYPAPDADGWIEWKGGECPVADGVIVDVKTRDGEIEYDKAYFWNWSHEQGLCIDPRQITAYRLRKQGAEVGVPKPERIVIEPDFTIEQLAADYRKFRDIAELKQKDADAAKADADAKLGELERAGEAIGLIIGIVKDEPVKSELNITDWRDLLSNDVIECLQVNTAGDDYADNRVGTKGRVIATEEPGRSGQAVKMRFYDGESFWVSKWRFIRRP